LGVARVKNWTRRLRDYRGFNSVSEILDDTIADRAPLSASTPPAEEQKIGGARGKRDGRRGGREGARYVRTRLGREARWFGFRRNRRGDES